MAALLLWGVSLVAFSAEAGFYGTAHLTPSAQRLSGEFTLAPGRSEPAYAAEVWIYAHDGVASRMAAPRFWAPGESERFTVDLERIHRLPGDYHLLVAVRFRDRFGAWQAAAIAFEYRYQAASPQRLKAPSVVVHGDGGLDWGEPTSKSATLLSTAAPAWETHAVGPNASDIPLERGATDPQPNATYPQIAVLSLELNGFHYSRLHLWELLTDEAGRPTKDPATNRPQTTWYMLATVGAALLILAGGLRRERNPRVTAENTGWLGWLTVLGMTAWLGSLLHPALWLTDTWPTGGDVASHVLYAERFAQWVAEGRLGGWMPEVFAGYPAFRYYFPLPFALAAAASPLLGLPVAFKLVTVLPALMLPAATFWFTGRLRWPVTARLGAALGCTGFLLTGATSMWGGNLLSQFAGEFSYALGMVFALMFLGTVADAVRRGGRRWLWAVPLEAATGVSHGYALLTAGFGALALALMAGRPAVALKNVMGIHALAFLLLGAWLLPLLEYAPWTIPNDTTYFVQDWSVLWPRSLWPFAFGLPLLIGLLWWSRHARSALAPIIVIAALGLLGFFVAPHMGLSDVRFYPYAQWAAAASLGGAVGWVLAYRRHGVGWILVGMLLLVGYWQTDAERPSEWAAWNLSGYQSKPMWPIYEELAQHLAGPLAAPRIAVEHARANDDLGSTRSLEALPLFGSRAVLEGLYMESASIAPFVYQLQADVSASASSPQQRFPSIRGLSADAAVRHMRELYADTLVLRSTEAKSRFVDDERFDWVAETGPLTILRLIPALRPSLIGPVEGEIALRPRDGWRERAFQRFVDGEPNADREVYLRPGELAPSLDASTDPGRIRVRVKEVSRERVVFETDAPGKPHLVRMTYHPAWVSVAGEPLFLTEPGFILMVPDSPQVTLEYHGTPADRLGPWLTAIGLAGLLLAWWKATPREGSEFVAPGVPVLLASIALLVVSWRLHPDYLYHAAHRSLQTGERVQAARQFEEAAGRRTAAAYRAESRFWAARSWQLAGERRRAVESFRALLALYPASYWAPEALFRLIEMEVPERAEHLQRLRRWVPLSHWRQQAEAITGAT